MDFNYKKSGTIFNMHTYWTKQPIDPIIYFIEKYSKANETILDPFSGSGMTGVAAIMTGRNFILNDISPISVHISKGYCTNYKAQKEIYELLDSKKKILSGLNEQYTTICIKCGERGDISFSIVGEVYIDEKGKEENRGLIMLNQSEGARFKKDSKFKEFRLLKVAYTCTCTKSRIQKDPDGSDLQNWNDKSYRRYFYPKDQFFGQEPKRNYKKGIKYVYQLYSSRNLTALSIIFDRIQKLKNESHRQLFLFIFTSILFNSSLMSRYRDYENTSIKMGTLYVPPLIKDTNVLSSFEAKFKIIIKGNAETFHHKSNIKGRFLCESADRLESIKNNSVDYIYTDPPYSDIINYSELNIVFESWLKTKTNLRDEMIVSKFQKKDIQQYSFQFEKFLLRCKEILREGRYLTLVFHHPNLSHWQHIQAAIFNSGFKPVITKEPIRLLSNSKTASQHKTKKNTQGFLVFNLVKDSNFKSNPLKELNKETYNRYISEIIKEARQKGFSNKPDCFDFILNKLIYNIKIQDFKL